MNAQHSRSTSRPSSSSVSRSRARELRRQQMRRRRVAGLVLVLIVALVAYEFAKPVAKTPKIITTARVTKPNRRALLPNPAHLTAMFNGAPASDGEWSPSGRLVSGHAAVFTTTLHLADQPTVAAGLAWMDTHLLVGQQYSGSLSPGGLNWKHTAPITSTAAKSLVVAFNGGFLMKDTKGGYYAEGKYAAPLRNGAASLVIYKNGTLNIGSWGSGLAMTPSVSSVRQNLVLLINNGKVAPNVSPTDTYQWGIALHQVIDTWRSAIGITADGALVYAYGPMNVLDLADVLLRAGAVRAMTLDMNPAWTNFAVFTPATPQGLASTANGVELLADAVNGPSRFFSSSYARDFITMSAR